MLSNSLIGAEYWRYETIDSHIWWPYTYISVIIPGVDYEPNGRKIKSIARESTGPIALSRQVDLSYSGNYVMTAVGPSNKTTTWSFYSTEYNSVDGYDSGVNIYHGTVTSNQYGKAKKDMSYITNIGYTGPTSGLVTRVWAESNDYITYADVIECVFYVP